jgi:hypothetical protein
MHPRQQCGFVRHGTYARKTPAGTLIARWYCRLGHCTFSLLPDHLAARFPDTLNQTAEQPTPTSSHPASTGQDSCRQAAKIVDAGHKRLDELLPHRWRPSAS